MHVIQQSHEWVRKEGDNLVYGITDHAQDALSDIVFVELPEVGASFGKGDTIGVVESVKAASDIYMPLAGEIVEAIEALGDAPEAINSDPYGAGWICKIKMSDPAEWDELLSAEDYDKFVGES